MSSTEPILEHRKQDEVLVVRFRDVSLLDESVFETIEAEISNLVRQNRGCPGVVIDLDGVKLVSTAVWGKLFVLGRRLRQEGCGLALCSMGPLLFESARALKVERFIPVEEEPDKAVDRLK